MSKKPKRIIITVDDEFIELIESFRRSRPGVAPSVSEAIRQMARLGAEKAAKGSQK